MTLKTSMVAVKPKLQSAWTHKHFALNHKQELLVKSTNEYRQSLAKKDKLIVDNETAKQLFRTPSPT